MTKSTQHIVEQRVKVVAKLLITGKSSEDIVHFSSVEWAVGERQTEKYIQKARVLISQSVKKEINYDYAKAIMRFEDLYVSCIERKDFRTALAVNKELASLQALYKCQIEHSGQVQFVCSVPD